MRFVLRLASQRYQRNLKKQNLKQTWPRLSATVFSRLRFCQSLGGTLLGQQPSRSARGNPSQGNMLICIYMGKTGPGWHEPKKVRPLPGPEEAANIQVPTLRVPGCWWASSGAGPLTGRRLLNTYRSEGTSCILAKHFSCCKKYLSASGSRIWRSGS